MEDYSLIGGLVNIYFSSTMNLLLSNANTLFIKPKIPSSTKNVETILSSIVSTFYRIPFYYLIRIHQKGFPLDSSLLSPNRTTYTVCLPNLETYSCAICKVIFNFFCSRSKISPSESPNSKPVSMIPSALPFSIFS